MGQDLSAAYRGRQYFGIGFEETADTFGRREALAILAVTVDHTDERDFRHDRDTLEALDFLTTQFDGRLPAARDFQAALAVEHSAERKRAVRAAYWHLCRVVSNGLAIAL